MADSNYNYYVTGYGGKIYPDKLGNSEFLWADRPAATGAGGMVIYITDVGVGGSYWVSDGVRWRVVGGSVTLINKSGTTATGATAYQLLMSAAIPAGLLQAGDRLQAEWLNIKSAASETFARALRFGVLNTFGDQYIVSNSQPATTNLMVFETHGIRRSSATTITPLTTARCARSTCCWPPRRPHCSISRFSRLTCPAGR